MNIIEFTLVVWVTSLLAGFIGSLTGLGGGIIITPLLTLALGVDIRYAMGLPFKVSTTTSNFMIGVTAAASAGVYLSRGYINPGLAMPVMLGVVSGSLVGARVLAEAKTKWLRIVFGVVIAVMAFEMIYHGVTGRL